MQCIHTVSPAAHADCMQVVKATSRVHGDGTEFQLTLKAAQGDMPPTTIEVSLGTWFDLVRRPAQAQCG